MVIQVYAPISNAEEAEVGLFYEDLQELLEVTAKKDVVFIRGDWNAKVGSQEIIPELGVNCSCSILCGISPYSQNIGPSFTNHCKFG